MRLTAIFTKVKERTCQEDLVDMIMWYKITQATPPLPPNQKNLGHKGKEWTEASNQYQSLYSWSP